MGCIQAKPKNVVSIKKINNKIYEIEYLDGSTYKGEMKFGMRSGQGEFIRKSYKRNSKCKTSSDNEDDNFIESYKGKWKNDEKSGTGTFTFQDGSVYIGKWKHDMRNGKGEYQLANLFKYNGNWVNNMMEGQGKMAFPQGYIYESEFSENFVTSKGRIITPAGVYYAVESLGKIYDFGMVFIKEGQDPQQMHEKFYCICLLLNWLIYEGWIDLRKIYAALLDSQMFSYNSLLTLKGDGILYNGEKGYTHCNWTGNFKFEGFGISYITSKEKYKGMFKEGLKNGYGVCIYKSGDIYKGEWEKNLKSGYGTMIYGNGKVFVGKWENDKKSSGKKNYPNGECFFGRYKHDKIRQGTYLYNNGDRYEGLLKNKIKIDQGIMTYKDGSTYKGQWEDDKPDGFGVYTSNDGWFYQGQWENGKKSGIGITSDDPNTLYNYSIEENPCKYRPPGEEQYTGSYLEGTLKNGNGKCEYANGDVYEGLWENDKKEGSGKFTWANQQFYDGNWKLDEMDGEGVLQMTDGSYYSGFFKNGQYFSKGYLAMADGTILLCDWDKGNIGPYNVKLDFNNGDKYNGPIQDLKKHGKGYIYLFNGYYMGSFENDIRHGGGFEELMTGEKFTGTWDHGLKQGRGTYQDEFENAYNGTWNMDKKHGKFVITFKTREVLTIAFENDKPVGKGFLDYSRCKKAVNTYEQSDILIDDEIKQVKWKSSAVKEIFKKTKKIKRYQNCFYSEPERCTSLVAWFKNQVI
ncbi:hypothetical protein SteCoe_37741 [Stentor coeruleus]|uniref:MORN repeat protein n=1 Tax=Stentor coeruleus TaxID=5963 RepID=A0A1R2AME8_9CILI|nr:hypothetical protein SteCoe_37741 [Stentor coeruleus]